MAKRDANPTRQANNIKVDGGRTRLEDAKISGYTDSKGRAISKAITDDTESSVGGYTNITSGRSAAVPHRPKNEK